MTPPDFTASPSQADQSESLEAISTMAAVFSELLRDPKKALKKPIGQWQPWLQEEGYSGEGFDRLLMSIVDQEHQAQDFELLSSAYYEGTNINQTTLNFLLTVKQQYPDLFRDCFTELTKKIISLEDTNTLAGGKLTGPAATFYKKHPVVSTLLLLDGVASGILIRELYLAHQAKKSLKDAIEKNTIKNTVEDTEAQEIQRLSSRSGSGSLDPERIQENIENHPVEIFEDESAQIKRLKEQMLTTDNVDKFVEIAMKDEAKALLSAEEQILLDEVKDGRSLLRWADNYENEGIIAQLVQDVETNNRYIRDQLGLEQAEIYLYNRTNMKPITVERLEHQFGWLKATDERIVRNAARIDQLKNGAFKAAYQNYVENGSTEKLNKALATLVEPDLRNNTLIEADYSKSASYLEGQVEDNEKILLNNMIDDTAKDTEALIKDYASNASDELMEYFMKMVQGAEDEINSFVDNRV